MEQGKTEVVITDIKVPFWSIFWIVFKVLAALLLLSLLVSLALFLFTAIFGVTLFTMMR